MYKIETWPNSRTSIQWHVFNSIVDMYEHDPEMAYQSEVLHGLIAVFDVNTLFYLSSVHVS